MSTTECMMLLLKSAVVKGIVQRKLRWVESGVNRWVMLQYWGAGHYFLILKGHYLVFRLKLLPPLEHKLLVYVGKNW
jgi:hypothetical protein